MTVLGTSNALLGIPYPQHKSGQTTTVQSFLYPGSVQPSATVTVLASSEALLGIAYPQHKSGQTTSVRSYLFPGAIQPSVTVVTPAVVQLMHIVGANFTRKVAVVGY